MMLSIGGVSELRHRLMDRSLGLQALKVLMAMIENADYENRVDISQAALAELVRMSQANVSRAAAELAEFGFLDRSKYRRGWYRLSPKLVWKGGATNLEKALKEAV